MKKLITLSALVSLGAVSCAFAADHQTVAPSQNPIKNGLYVGAAAGWGAIQSEKVTGFSRDIGKGVAMRANIGYNFLAANNVLIGTEAGFTGYPSNHYSRSGYIRDNIVKISGNTVDLLATMQYYFTNKVNLIGKFGIAATHQRSQYTVYGATSGVAKNYKSYKTTKVLPELAVGIGYNLTRAVNMNVTYNHVFGKNPNISVSNDIVAPTDSNVGSINTVLLGASYNF